MPSSKTAHEARTYISVILATVALVFGAALAAQAQTSPYLDANGWTVFTPSADTRTIYVSNSAGNDVNDGLSTSTPVKTIARGLSLIRSGYPDWLLLKKGDTWTNETFSYLAVSGRSAAEPMLISSYGAGARPLIKTNFDIAIGSLNGGASAGKGDFIALVGIELYPYTRDPSSPDFVTPSSDQYGTRFLNPITWFLIEDCKFSFYAYNVDFDASSTGSASIVSIRRNIVVDAYSNLHFAEGIYVDGIVNRLYEENLFDHNGWNTSVSGAGPLVYNRNVYDQFTNKPGILPNGPAIFRGNISARSSSEGAQIRPGGTISNNLFDSNPIGFDIGHRLSDGAPLITSATASNNVVLKSDDMDSSNPRGIGIEIMNASGGGIQVMNNIIAHAASANPTNAYAFILDPNTSGVSVTGNIIYDWNYGILDQGTGNITSPNATNLTGYPNPNLSVETYDATLGGPGTLADFLTRARGQSKDNWNTALMAAAVNNYIKTGFGITATTSPSSTTPPSVPTGLAGTAASSTQVNLSWTASTDNVGVAGYNVFRNGTKVGSIQTTSYQDTGLSAGTTYIYTVSAYDVAGNTSAQSGGVSISTPIGLTVAITSPANGSVLKGNGSVNIAVTASDAVAVPSITIMADSNVLYTCTNTSSCSATWHGQSITQGTHTIGATAVDQKGNHGSASVAILAVK